MKEKQSDLISREALAKEFERFGLGEHSLIERFFADGVYAVIENAPAVDAVPVEVLATIAYYNGHLDWLRDLAEKLEHLEEGEMYINPVPTNEWCSERHMFWEILVGMFGDWGTSIRSGWIEKTKEAAAFIKKLIEGERKE